MDLRCGLLDSSKMHTHFFRAVWIQEVNSMSRGKSEEALDPAQAV